MPKSSIITFPGKTKRATGGLQTLPCRCDCGLVFWKLLLSHTWHGPTQPLHVAALGSPTPWRCWDNQIFWDTGSKFIALRDPGRNPKASYDLASKVQKCPLCCIPCIGQVRIDLREWEQTRPSLSVRGASKNVRFSFILHIFSKGGKKMSSKAWASCDCHLHTSARCTKQVTNENALYSSRSPTQCAWWSKCEGNSKKRRYRYTSGWLTLLYSRN